MAGITESRHCAIDVGLPGRFTIKHVPRIPAVCRERIAVGTYCRLTWRISSPKPGIIFAHTTSVASGVMSRRAGPVPPVVTMSEQPSVSANSINVAATKSVSSGTMREISVHSLVMCLPRYSRIAGPPKSSYTPCDARSETVTTPMRATTTATTSHRVVGSGA